MKKLSNISESMWGDIHRRNSGEVARKEDDVNFMDFETFGEYLRNFNKKEVTRVYLDPAGKFITIDEIDIILETKERSYERHYQLLLTIEYSESKEVKDIRLPYSFKSFERNVYSKMTKEFSISIKRNTDLDLNISYLHINPKDGSKKTNRFFLDVLNFLVDNFKNKYLNESMWGDIHRRNSGEMIRKEDGNLSDIKPVDMGISVLWADRDLEMNGEIYFEYDKVNQLIKNTGWRLPTKEEVSELQSLSIQVEKSTDEVYILSKKVDPDTKLVFEKKGYKYALDEKIYRETTYYAWTSSKYKHNTASWAFRIIGTYHLASFPMDKLNRICVRLVKDKKNVNESMWGDIHRRNSGEVVRKEDAFNPEYIDFGDNTTVYWAKENLVIDGESRFYFDDVQNYNNNGWRLPTNKEVKELNWSKVDIYWAYGYVNIEFKGIEDGILRIKRDVSSTGFHMWTKDRHERFKNDTYAYGYDNSYHFMVEPWGHINKCYVFLVKDKKKVNESMWGDIHRRNSGEAIRKEDDINLLDENDFEKYLQDHYNVINGYSIYNLGGITVPVLKSSYADERTFALIYDGIYQDIDISDDLQDYYPQLYKELQKEFVLSHRGCMFNITPKSGEKCTNKFCIEVLDFIINNAKKDLIIEKR